MSDSNLDVENRAKYGDKQFDLISQFYRVSKEQGDVMCIASIQKYLDRFKRPGSPKGNNVVDLLKCRDYLDRMIEANEIILNEQKQKEDGKETK